MASCIELVLNSVNLSGYGRSKGFIGFFEKTGKYQNGMAEQAVSFFFRFFEKKLLDMVIVSSLRFNIDDIPLYYSESEISDNPDCSRHLLLVDELISVGLLERLSYQSHFALDVAYEENSPNSEYFEKYDQAVRFLESQFSEYNMNNYSVDDLRKLLVTPMLGEGIHGHCFVVSEQNGLIFYPTSDTGFGVIAINEMSNLNLACDFLQKSGEMTNFHFVLENRPRETDNRAAVK